MHFLKHLRLITRHRHKVMRLCFKVGIGFQGLFHDLSKYSWAELIPGAKFYAGDHSPTEVERKTKGYSLAWMHHKGRNKHHIEYWTDISVQSGEYEPVLMPIRYLKESFCDRIAASKLYEKKNYRPDSALSYFRRQHTAQKMHPLSAEVLEQWLLWVSTEGEKQAFRKIKKIKTYEQATTSI